MTRNKDYAQKYAQEFEKMLKKGYTEPVQTNNKSLKWYLLHRSIINVNKPDKLLVVFDCSAKSNQICLKDMVLKSPDLMNNLLGVLLRFCCGPIAVAGDIEAMYNQVRVTPDDHNKLCFLFWPNGDICKQPVEYRMYVHLFRGSWSPCTANYAMKRVVHELGGNASKIVTDKILRNFNADDC